MANNQSAKPYGSARDLPSVQEIETQLRTFSRFRMFLPRDMREQLAKTQHDLERTIHIVEKIYGLLGSRNWVFTDDLNLDAMEQIAENIHPETAERQLIDYYQQEGRIEFPLQRLHRFNAIRPRMDLLKKALEDYRQGRYYSCVFVLISVMDGFVNELDTSQRRGLHSRSSEELVAWDSVAGHHLGLSNAHKSFGKGFYKTDSAEITELYRHGIMHGTLTNFDNEIIATKAWNRLFAVTDWADAKELQSKPAEPEVSACELARQWRELQKEKHKLELWQPYTYEPDLTITGQTEVVNACMDFLERWQKKQWGPVGAHFIQIGPHIESIGSQARLAKELYAQYELDSWNIHSVRHTAAAVAHTDVILTVNEKTYHTDLRWVRINNDRTSTTEWNEGWWSLSQYGPTHFLKPDKIVTLSSN